MKISLYQLTTFIIGLLLLTSIDIHASDKGKYVVVIHGGAGTILKKNMSPEKEQAYKAKLDEALVAAEKILKAKGTCVEAVKAAIMVMENSPLFNAGKGAVFTNAGKNELDASIMRGKDLNAGAVAGVTNIKNPIHAAIMVMDNSEHVMLAGKGASDFAKSQDVEIVDPKYFYTKSRWESLQRLIKKEREITQRDKHGTVGCVVLDTYGNLAAGTSTGGMTNKKYGRIGDSPIIGAGTYANNKTCAISCTGHGEYYIRLSFARDISAMMEYQGITIENACKQEVRKLTKLGGTGGTIAVDKDGNVAMEFNTAGMYRGYIKSSGEKIISIYK
ncbi:isoaspartyl peptidase/L-asparaginase [Puteibacter caeruleilacunae]|nr:isoaspartyl peptidase/L-asparaginase [Puteibacter caeruleilacunae]